MLRLQPKKQRGKQTGDREEDKEGARQREGRGDGDAPRRRFAFVSANATISSIISAIRGSGAREEVLQ
jgi:hypothetical protein